MLVCRSCAGYSVCSGCASARREACLPSLSADPLLQGPDSPCVLLPGPRAAQGRGTVIVCPGGNYEFLCSSEGMPVAKLLAENNICAMVLRYRLLPRHRPGTAVADLAAAVRLVRGLRNGPVAAMGFSAGGHLVASYSQRCGAKSDCSRSKRRVASRHRLHKGKVRKGACTKACTKERHSKSSPLDAQVLVYPAIDGRGWLNDDECGFFQYDECMAQAPLLLRHQHALMGGPGFAAPQSFLVASTGDPVCPPKEHADVYAAALSKRGIPHTYLRRNFGDHGFGVGGGWASRCIKWLKEAGFGDEAE